MEQKQEYVTFGRQVGYVIIAHIALFILELVQIAILTKGLGTTLYGVWSLINVTIALILPFAMINLGLAIVRFLAAEKDRSRIRDVFLSAWSIVFISGTVLSLILFLLSDFLATSVFKDISSSFYIKIASVLILLNSMQNLTLAFFRMRRKIGLYSILNVIYVAFQVGLILVALLLGYELTGAITALIIAGIISNLINLLIILREIGFQIPSFSGMKSYIKWGLPLAPNVAILWIINSSDRYIVSYFLGLAAAGIYDAAYTVGKYASFALMPLGIVLYPTIAKYYDEGNLSETRKYLKYSVKYLMMVAIPSAFGLSILAKPLLQILTTPEFIAGSTVVPFVAFGAVLFSFYQICVYIFHLVGRTELTVRLLIISAVLNIALNLVLIPRMGIPGAALATLIAYGVLGMLTLMLTRRYLKFDISLRFVAKSIVASAIMTLCIWLISPASILSVILSLLLGAGIYFAMLFLIKGFNKQEIDLFIHFARDNLRKIRLLGR